MVHEELRRLGSALHVRRATTTRNCPQISARRSTPRGRDIRSAPRSRRGTRSSRPRRSAMSQIARRVYLERPKGSLDVAVLPPSHNRAAWRLLPIYQSPGPLLAAYGAESPPGALDPPAAPLQHRPPPRDRHDPGHRLPVDGSGLAKAGKGGGDTPAGTYNADAPVETHTPSPLQSLPPATRTVPSSRSVNEEPSTHRSMLEAVVMDPVRGSYSAAAVHCAPGPVPGLVSSGSVISTVPSDSSGLGSLKALNPNG